MLKSILTSILLFGAIAACLGGALGPDLDSNGVVLRTAPQTLLADQQAQVRLNLGPVVLGGTTATYLAGQVITTGSSVKIYLTSTTGLVISGSTVTTF